MDKQRSYLFQNIDTGEKFETVASNSTEAIYKCRIEKKWPLDKARYLGKHPVFPAMTPEKIAAPGKPR